MDKILAILPISIGGRLTTSSLIDGFLQNNFDAVVFDELKNDNFQNYLNDDYKFIVGYDFSPIKLKVDYSINIPLIAYFSDDINLRTAGVDFDKLKKHLYQNNNFIFYWDRTLSKLENLNYMPHFVNLEIYKNYKKPTKDVLFMGRLDTELRLNMFIKLNKLLPQYSFSWYAIKKHYNDALSRLSSQDKEIIKKTYSGFIDNEKDMADVINNHKIVYNVNSQGISSLNYRTIQTLACKRLLISDNREELDLFDNVIPIYSNVEDLSKKIIFYIENSYEYNKTIEKSYDFIKKNHNSKISVKKMLESII